MIKTSRCIALLLILTLLCGMITVVHADVVTLGIYFCGRRTAEDGTEQIVRLDGRFRVTQNGQEAGTIDAGKTTLTLPGTDRIRIEPLPESILPGWDLSSVAREVIPEAGGTTTVSIVVDLLKADASQPAETPVPVPTPAPAETGDEPGTGETETVNSPAEEPEDREETGNDAEDGEPDMTGREPVVTPTMPPYDLSALAPTPEPEWKTLPAGTGSLRAYAFYDQNNNGLVSDGEIAVSKVTVCLLTENDEAVAAITTGKNGIALFENLPEGSYKIKAILPDGWAFNKKAVKDDPYASVFEGSYEGEALSGAIRVSADETATPGISLTKCLHVSGTCWFETTVDGLFATDEAVLPGVKIELDGERNGMHYETVSGEDGTWRIERVAPAAYRLRAYAPDGMMFTRAANRNGRKNVIARDGVTVASRSLDLNDKESKDRQYIGFTWAGQISGMCFLDANYNGVYDEGDLPMAGVKVTAIQQAKDEELAVTYSGEDGTYLLNGLRGNTYKMRAVLPDDGSDFTRTVNDPLGNHFASRPGRRENFWKDFTLATSERRVMNVGVIYPASVTGTVYQDNDFSGTLNGKEKIVTSYLVKLVDENGNTVAMDKTSIKGKYELTGVPPGTYSLSVTALKNYAFTKLGEGNVILNRTNGEGYSEFFSLGLGENKTGMDIGMILPGTVRGSVFADRNDNGVRDADENGLAGVTVRLVSDDGEAFRAEIGANGDYLFDAVMPGTYRLEYMLPENAVFARVTNGGNTISGERTGLSDPFDMSSGMEITGPVCGALTLGRIEGSAYQDHNGNGIQDEGEENSEGLTLTLMPSRGELEPVTVTTGEDGRFLLDALRPDSWTLTAQCAEHYVMSRTDNLKLPLTAGRDTQTVQLPVAMGAEWTGQQIGTVIPASLSGQLWLDENNNGLFDAGERTPSGYEVIVTDDRTGRTFDTLRTDGEGRFATSGMIPGSFTLSFPLDERTIAPKSGNSDFSEENGALVYAGIELGEEEHRDGLLLGIVRYTAIGGSVWIDRGDSLEPLPGTEIILKDGEGNNLSTQTTAGNGVYRFDMLMPGTYRLEASVPEGCVIIEPGDQRLNGEQISVLTETLNRTGSSDLIELTMADDLLRMNIGCVLPGRIGDFCWLDLYKDGLQGMDEPGIPGVKIALIRNGEIVAETITDQYGFYRINDLYPATYSLRVTAPEEVKPTTRRTDIRIIASVLEETEDTTSESVEFQVESDKANYNVDIGFVCRKDGVWPAGTGEGKTQDWTGIAGSDN